MYTDPIYADSSGIFDDALLAHTDTSWSNVRNDTTSTTYSEGLSYANFGVYARRQATRGGGVNYYNYRSFFSFNLSAYEGKQVEAADIYIHALVQLGSNENVTRLVIALNQLNGNTGDYGSIMGLSNAMVAISDKTTCGVGLTHTKFKLNSTGIDAINRITMDNKTPLGSTIALQCAIVSDKWDYNDTTPGLFDQTKIRIYYAEQAGSKPYLKLKIADYNNMSLGVNF